MRLKGFGHSLKRSKRLQLPSGVDKPRHTELLETLNVFGIHADYMVQFKQFLEYEGLPADQETEEIVLPVLKNIGAHKLKVIRLKPEINGVPTSFGTAFRLLAPVPELGPPAGEMDQWLLRNKVQLNWYPKIQALKARGLVGGDGEADLDRGKLSRAIVSLLDLDKAWFELLRYKNERGWHNFNIPRGALNLLLDKPDWYDLLIPEAQLRLDTLEKLPMWQEIAESLLKKYAERYYSFRKKGWEEPHLEYTELASDDANFPSPGEGVGEEQGAYRLTVEKSEAQLISQLKRIRQELRKRTAIDHRHFKGDRASVDIIGFSNHLFEPMIAASGASITVKPVAMNDGELKFVARLKTWCQEHPEELLERPLFLLRNLSRGRGVGFFEAGNFYPDFMLWRLDGTQQRIMFVDPKGIRNLDSIDDPKIGFHKTIREIEQRLGAPDVSLRSFIVSVTPASEMTLHWKGVTKAEMEANNILFDEDEDYIARLLEAGAA